MSRAFRAWSTVVRMSAAVVLMPYVHTAYRVRGWGRLPRHRGPTLVIANHQHDLDSMAIMAHLTVDGPWTKPIHTVSSRRMFEPGFFAVRTPWLGNFVRRYDPAPLFAALGPMPIENDLRRRSLHSVALSIMRRHGNVLVGDVFDETDCAELGVPRDVRVDRLGDVPWFAVAQRPVEVRRLREPHRSEVLEETRRFVRDDLARIERTLREGGTFFLTPEGHYTVDGRMQRFRDAYARLAPFADVWLAAIAYDPLRGRRLSQLYRILRPARADDVVASLAAARPVTASQLLARWMLSRSGSPFSEGEAVSGVVAAMRDLPPTVFVDPELRRRSHRVARSAVRTTRRLGVLADEDVRLRLAQVRRHPKFEAVDDIVAFQARFLEETLDAAQRLAAAPP